MSLGYHHQIAEREEGGRKGRGGGKRRDGEKIAISTIFDPHHSHPSTSLTTHTLSLTILIPTLTTLTILTPTLTILTTLTPYPLTKVVSSCAARSSSSRPLSNTSSFSSSSSLSRECFNLKRDPEILPEKSHPTISSPNLLPAVLGLESRPSSRLTSLFISSLLSTFFFPLIYKLHLLPECHLPRTFRHRPQFAKRSRAGLMTQLTMRRAQDGKRGGAKPHCYH